MPNFTVVDSPGGRATPSLRGPRVSDEDAIAALGGACSTLPDHH
ncbi:MAG: hypothetical protein ACLS63_11285 [Flavonifractor plautii]